MKKRFKQIYVEITNVCNFDCSFCAKHHRKYEYMKPEVFRNIVHQIAPYTDLVYLHVMGEPLLHPDIGLLMDMVKEEGLQVGLTTNGILLPKVKEQLYDRNIKRINLSLHSYYDVNNQVPPDTCMNVLEAADTVRIRSGATVFYRLWDIDHPEAEKMLNLLIDRYHPEDDISLLKTDPNGIRLAYGVRLQLEHPFEWPVNAREDDTAGTCQALRTHIAILVNGDVVPCCLDNEGTMKLGNIMETPFAELLTQKNTVVMRTMFQNHKLVHPLCKQCSYRKRFDK